MVAMTDTKEEVMIELSTEDGAAAQNATAGEQNSEQSAQAQVSMPILSDVTAAQAAHGLKHSDYDRYRRYCTRRLARLRAATGTTNRHPTSAHKYSSAEVDVDVIVAKPRALLIPLVLAERDWAYAIHIKRTQPSSPARARRHLLARLTRAVSHSARLAALARSCADESTMLDAEAYAHTMRATLCLERDVWSQALSAYSVAHKIYAGMAAVREGTVDAALFQRKLEDISHAMRLCRYNLARDDGSDANSAHLLQTLRIADGAMSSSDAIADKIDAALADARRRAAVSFGDVTWCGVVVALRSERVREAVMVASDESAEFEKRANPSVDEYDKLFVVLNDAINVVTTELREFSAASAGVDDRVVELEMLVAYLTFQRLQHTTSRNLLLIENLRASRRASKPDDFVRLYDSLISNMTDVLGLQGVQQDAEKCNEAEARRKLFQAHRCFHLAQCYQAAQLQSEAAALFDRVGEHASALTGTYGEEAGQLVLQSRGMKWRARAEAMLNGLEEEDRKREREMSQKGGLGRMLMVEHLDEVRSFVGGDGKEARVAVCEMPPKLEAVACKPVVFDLAIDGVMLPVEAETTEAVEPAESAKAAVGSEQGDVSKKSKQEEMEKEKDASAAKSGFASRLGRWWSGSG